MSVQKVIRCAIVLTALFVLLGVTSCSSVVEEDAFTFTVPPGYKTTTFYDYSDSSMDANYLVFTQNKHVYFQIYRQTIPQDGNLDSILANHQENLSEESSHYQFISQDPIRVADHDAIQFVYRKFHGEPYIQVQEIWIEDNGDAYTLTCSEPVDATPGIEIPIAEDCDRLMAGFRFNDSNP